MWPALFGSGWQWGVLVALSLACLFVGLLGFLLLVVNKPRREAAAPLDQLWHRYEEGDLIRKEFDRARRRTIR